MCSTETFLFEQFVKFGVAHVAPGVSSPHPIKKKDAPAGDLCQTLRCPVPPGWCRIGGGARIIISETPGSLFMISLSVSAKHRANAAHIRTYQYALRIAYPCAHLQTNRCARKSITPRANHTAKMQMNQPILDRTGLCFASRSPAPLRDPIPFSTPSCRPVCPAL